MFIQIMYVRKDPPHLHNNMFHENYKKAEKFIIRRENQPNKNWYTTKLNPHLQIGCSSAPRATAGT